MTNEVEIKGKKYPVKLKFMAVAEYQAETGKGFDVILNLTGNLIEIPKVLWYGIKHGCKAAKVPFTLTLEEVEEALDNEDITIDKAFGAIHNDIYQATDEEKREADATEKSGGASKKK